MENIPIFTTSGTTTANFRCFILCHTTVCICEQGRATNLRRLYKYKDGGYFLLKICMFSRAKLPVFFINFLSLTFKGKQSQKQNVFFLPQLLQIFIYGIAMKINQR